MGVNPFGFSTTAGSNTMIGGVNAAEQNPVKNQNNIDRAIAASIKELLNTISGKLALAGGTTAYTVTTDCTIATLADGLIIVAKINATNTGASTLAPDSLSAKAIVKMIGGTETALAGGEMVAGQWAIFLYNSSLASAAGAWVLLNPDAGTAAVRRADIGVAQAQKTFGVTPNEGLVCKYISATVVDVDATAVVLFNSTGEAKRYATLDESPAITASGANGLDTGSEGSSRWYHIWAIGKADGTLDALLSESASSPTMPSGYTYKGYLGAIYNNSSSNFRSFLQNGNIAAVIGTGNAALSGGASTSYLQLDCAAYVPPTAKEIEIVAAVSANAGSGQYTLNVSNSGSGTTPGLHERYASGFCSTTQGYFANLKVLLTAQAFYWYLSNADARLGVYVVGWRY